MAKRDAKFTVVCDGQKVENESISAYLVNTLLGRPITQRARADFNGFSLPQVIDKLFRKADGTPADSDAEVILGTATYSVVMSVAEIQELVDVKERIFADSKITYNQVVRDGQSEKSVPTMVGLFG